MRAGWVVGLLAAGAVGLVGCDGGTDRPPPEPIPTDGPNQVVVFVPAMV